MKLVRREIVLGVLIGFLFTAEIFGQDKPDTEIGKTAAVKPLRIIPNNAFSVGEQLYFDIHWEIAHVGNATLSVARKSTYNGSEVYEIESRAQSNKVISSIYKVDDRVNSLIDVNGIYSHRLEKHLSEGNYRADRLFLFDQENNIAIAHRDSFVVPEFTQDVLSAFYYVRTQKLEIGQTIEVPHFDNGKIYNLLITILRKQRIRVPAGTFNCWVIEPKLEGEGLFKHQGRITIYLTADERKIPVLLVSKVIFGEVAAKLTKIEGVSF
ncbi:DUF3108 domain-containing protein [candidate division KSB1 bacterium]